jgi:hypothetical protein
MLNYLNIIFGLIVHGLVLGAFSIYPLLSDGASLKCLSVENKPLDFYGLVHIVL